MPVTVERIDLLDDVSYDINKKHIPHVPKTWWMRTAFSITPKLIACAPLSGKVKLNDEDIERALGVRPYMVLKGVTECYNFLDKVDVFGVKWSVLNYRHDLQRLCLLCDEFVAYRRFDDESCDWRTSELKAWLEEWLEYVVMGNENNLLK